MKLIFQSLVIFIWMTLLTGVLYPLCVFVIAYTISHDTAEGSFITHQGKIIGSSLIAQKFESERYFWPRPSAVDYNPLPSGGSNLGPTSATLKKTVEERRQHLAAAHGISELKQVPPELLFASGSGLDPHINLSTAFFQMERVAKARGMNQESAKQKLKNLILSLAENRFFRFSSEPYVNVLNLNHSLDQLDQEKTQ
jgi:potassium-transporting ATPase KdpC subunit